MLRGNIKDFGFAKVVQLVCGGRRAGKLTLSRAGENAEVYFVSGAVVHARVGDETGTRAFRKIADWPEGEFMLEYGKTTEERTIDTPLWFLFNEVFFDETPL